VDPPQFFDPPYPLKNLQAGLASYQNLRVNILDCWIRPVGVEHMLEHTAKVRPDLVVLSASSFDVNVADDFVASLKRQNGGPLLVGIGQGTAVRL
jgi:hypothetical protein